MKCGSERSALPFHPRRGQSSSLVYTKPSIFIIGPPVAQSLHCHQTGVPPRHGIQSRRLSSGVVHLLLWTFLLKSVWWQKEDSQRFFPKYSPLTTAHVTMKPVRWSFLPVPEVSSDWPWRCSHDDVAMTLALRTRLVCGSLCTWARSGKVLVSQDSYLPVITLGYRPLVSFTEIINDNAMHTKLAH